MAEFTTVLKQLRSSSSRRTWIEIEPYKTKINGSLVVLLAEDVDRNIHTVKLQKWIKQVVLLAEDVDRNRLKKFFR